MSNGQIKMWYRRFKDGRESVKSDSRSGRPSRRTSENVNRVRVAINENPRLTIRKLGEALGIPRTVVNVILTEDLGMSHVPAKFVSTFLCTFLDVFTAAFLLTKRHHTMSPTTPV